MTARKEKAAARKRGPKSPWDAAKASQRNARRDIILRAATRCLNRHGYAGASMAIIAKELGVSYNALYHYFESKQDILVHAFRRTNELLGECLTSALTGPDNGLVRLLGFVSAFQRLIVEQEPPALALFLHLPKPQAAALARRREGFLEGLQQIIRDGIADGSVRALEPAVAANFVLGALESFPYWDFIDDLNSVSTSLQAFVRHGLKA